MPFRYRSGYPILKHLDPSTAQIMSVPPGFKILVKIYFVFSSGHHVTAFLYLKIKNLIRHAQCRGLKSLIRDGFIESDYCRLSFDLYQQKAEQSLPNNPTSALRVRFLDCSLKIVSPKICTLPTVGTFCSTI